MKKLKLQEINNLIIRNAKTSKSSFEESLEKDHPDFIRYLDTIDEKFNVVERAMFITGIALAWYAVDKLIAKVPAFSEEVFEKHAQAFEDEMESALSKAGNDPDESSDAIERISSQPNLIFSMFNLLHGMRDAVKKKDVRQKKLEVITYYYIVFAEAIVRSAVFSNKTEIVSIKSGKTIKESVIEDMGKGMTMASAKNGVRESQGLYVVGNGNKQSSAGVLVIYKLTITLNDIKPKIWRSVLIPSDLTLHDFHRVIQSSMGWTNSHLYRFSAEGTSYMLPEPGEKSNGKTKNPKRYRVGDIMHVKGDQVVYEYDFGDGWAHTIQCADVADPKDTGTDPVCVGGARACPPENCGGAWGYARILEAIRNPMHPEHESIRHRIGGFMPEDFDLNEINARLHEKDYGCFDW